MRFILPLVTFSLAKLHYAVVAERIIPKDATGLIRLIDVHLLDYERIARMNPQFPIQFRNRCPNADDHSMMQCS